jgi:hypothetical protein
MRKRLKLKDRVVRIEDISFDVICPVEDCGNEYHITATKPSFMRNAGKCGHGTFYVTIMPMKGMVEIAIRFQKTSGGDPAEVEPQNLEIEGE